MKETESSKPTLKILIKRGLQRKCPQCGRGALYKKWISMNDNCPECGLQYLQNQGDPWAFLLFSDRFFFLPIIAAIYFSTLPGNSIWLYIIFGGIALFYILTMPHRYGFCVALDYFTRIRWGDLAEKRSNI